MYKLIITILLVVVVGTIVSILLLKKVRRAKSRRLYNRALKIKNKIERGDLSIGILPLSAIDTMQDLLVKSGRLGNSKAWFELAMYHYKDMGLIYDEDSKNKALDYFKKAGEAGYGIAAWNMYVKTAYFYKPSNANPEKVKQIVEKYLEQDTTGEMALLKGYMLYCKSRQCRGNV